MSGIDRLRALAGAWDAYGLGGTLGDVARQIERERACDEDAIENVRLIVGGVIDDMEHHVSGVEGMEDSPVARWARELREALKSYTSDGRDTQNPSCADPDGAADVTSEAPKVTRGPAEDASMSAYDLLPADERDAIAWVRDHGGLSHVKDIYHDFRAVVELLGIEWSESELHGLMDALDRRLMPEGMEWPRYESGEQVGFGDEVSRLGEVFSISLYCDGSFALNFRAYSKGERVKRHAVLAADGEPLEVRQTVWNEAAVEFKVEEINPRNKSFTAIRDFDGSRCDGLNPMCFTHQRPDSWERIEEDIADLPCSDYCNIYRIDASDTSYEHAMARDIVRRCKALAERERSE